MSGVWPRFRGECEPEPRGDGDRHDFIIFEDGVNDLSHTANESLFVKAVFVRVKDPLVVEKIRGDGTDLCFIFHELV